ncbi:DNA-binding response regulator, OmpR family, contains REC and winged-helix (WHTH) domain [Arthrobacter sp. 9AX]|uniref:response regulator transcription factor n=1 Tax=Arthrobacter sp. 9AX TaxID=2653131 RepID=UPI0012EF209D|nr:response regulator transcription factor [Arthrobacter sp. 9AX]VXB96070.1 DNA-binding response regulator, OmpR family, contains REC and winged-helix (WHTH) domain [Arthrobacter sp. 9AX]
MTTAERLALLLVEDDPVLGPLIAELLEADYAVRLAAHGQEGLHLGLTQPWDVMVIDRGLPMMDGISVITALRSKGISTPILILTALGDTREKVRGLDAGANDYVTKPFDAGELAARLRALTRTYSQPAGPVSIGTWELDPASRAVRSVYGDLVTLTAKEAEVLAALAAEPGRVFTRDDLLAAHFHPTDQPGVIDTYVHHLRRKISRTVIRTVHGIGYQIGDAS